MRNRLYSPLDEKRGSRLRYIFAAAVAKRGHLAREFLTVDAKCLREPAHDSARGGPLTHLDLVEKNFADACFVGELSKWHVETLPPDVDRILTCHYAIDVVRIQLYFSVTLAYRRGKFGGQFRLCLPARVWARPGQGGPLHIV